MDSRQFLVACSAVLISVLAMSQAHALSIKATSIDLTDLVQGQDRWQFDYQLSGPVPGFFGASLSFPVAEFSQVALAAMPPPSDWLGVVTPGDASAPFDGLVQFTAQADLGAASTDHFVIDLVWNHPQPVYQQPVDFLDDGGNVLSSGLLPVSVASVPETDSRLLLGAGLSALVGFGRHRLRHSQAASPA